jgi:chromate reductase
MVNLLAFAASARKASYNKLLIDEAVDIARELGANVSLYQFKDFEAPLYDGDLELDIILPTGVKTFAKLLMSHDGMLISTPEYNHAMPGTLKNLIDWVSRPKPFPTLGKTCFLMSASPSVIGGQRGLWHTRQPMEAIGTIIYPAMYSLPEANKAFDQNGTLIDSKRRARLKELLAEFVSFADSVAAGRKAMTDAGS